MALRPQNCLIILVVQHRGSHRTIDTSVPPNFERHKLTKLHVPSAFSLVIRIIFQHDIKLCFSHGDFLSSSDKTAVNK